MANVEEAGLPGAYTVAPLVVAPSSSGTSTTDFSTDTPITTLTSSAILAVSVFDERARLSLRGSTFSIAFENDWRLAAICCIWVALTVSSKSSPTRVDPADSNEPTLLFCYTLVRKIMFKR